MPTEFDSKSDVKEMWEQNVLGEEELADRVDSFYAKTIVKNIQDVVDIERDDRILEVGAGWGRLISQFDRQAETVGLDIAVEQLRIQREITEETAQIVGDGENLPFPSDAFDLVYASRVLQYYDDITEFLSEFKRVMKPSGKMIVIQPNKSNPYLWATYYTKLISHSEIVESVQALGLSHGRTKFFGYSPHSTIIPQLEVLGHVPVLRRIGGYYLVVGSYPDES